MSSIKTFKERYPTPINQLEEKIKEIEAMDILSIKKLDMIEKAKEISKKREYRSYNSTFRKDDFYDQMIIGYGIF